MAEGFVYFISDGEGLVKIGVTNNVQKRLASLQTASPRKLELVASVESQEPFKLEKRLHKEFDGLRASGEWFRMDSQHAKDIADGLNGKICEHCGNPPFHYFGVSYQWFQLNANFALLSKCPRHLAFYHGKPHYEPGLEIIEDMPVIERVIKQVRLHG